MSPARSVPCALTGLVVTAHARAVHRPTSRRKLYRVELAEVAQPPDAAGAFAPVVADADASAGPLQAYTVSVRSE